MNKRILIPFNDMLFNLLLCTLCLFIIAFLSINPIKQDQDVESSDVLQIVLTWGDENDDDFDLWLITPDKQYIGFKSPQTTLGNLDRDDLGIANDTIIVNGEGRSIKLNKEIISLRQLIPGDYYINVHYYKQNDKPAEGFNVEVSKIKPYKLVFKGSNFLLPRQEKTIVSFTVTEKYDITNIATDNQVSFVDDLLKRSRP